MLPEAQSEDLLYVASLGEVVYVFSYPSLAVVGQLDLRSYNIQGLCVDARGDVFVPAWAPGQTSTTPPRGVVFEYAHGSTQYMVLRDPSATSFGCSVDQTTGNLAVTNTTSHGAYTDGDVVIYQEASGTPTSYIVPHMNAPQWIAYDSAGDLFVDGSDNVDDRVIRKSAFGPTLLAELAKGSSVFKPIRLHRDLGNGSLQWNQGYLTLASIEDTRGTIYRASIDGRSAKIVGTTRLRLHTNRIQGLQSQYLIQGTNILGAGWRNWLQVWAYPKGGKALQRLHTYVGLIGGVAISPASKRD